MRQVQDLDLDITRTRLHVAAIRRVLASSQRDLFQAELRVSKLSTRRDRLHSIEGLVQTLVEVNKIKSECDQVTHPLSARIRTSQETLNKLAKEYPQELAAVKSAVSSLKNRIPQLEAAVLENLKAALLGPRLNLGIFEDVLSCFETLNYDQKENLELSKQVWKSMLELYLTPSNGNTGVMLTKSAGGEAIITPDEQVIQKRPFVQVFDTSSAYAEMLSKFVGAVSDDNIKESLANMKRECQSIITKLADDYLKNPLIRSQVLDDFALTIEDASKLTEKLDAWFGEIEQSTTQYINKTKLESSIRLRARVYAQQYQAEGFQAMRGLLWRELWVDVGLAASTSKEEDFAQAIFKRLGVQAPEMGGGKRYVFTATVASGLPRQIQRTLDLMKKLPTSACGEAFLGLLRIVDLYLYAVLTLFVHKSIFLDSPRKFSKTIAWQYMNQVRESLGEWLTPASPRSSLPPSAPMPVPDDQVEPEDVQLCEMEFLRDTERSFEAAYVASESLEFVSTLVKLLEKPLSDPLPSVERSKLGSKMFVELPQVVSRIQLFVRRSAIERLTQKIQFGDLGYVYGEHRGDDYDDSDSETDPYSRHTSADAGAQFAMFRDVLVRMNNVFQELQNSRTIPEPVRRDLWDEACAMFLDKYLQAISKMQYCNAIDRGNMIVHLASFWEKLNEFPGSRAVLQRQGSSALKSRSRVDDYIKAFYYDKPQDLWDWMKRKKDDYDQQQFLAILETGLVGQSVSHSTSYLSTGSGGSRLIGGKKELRQEFDKVMQSVSLS
jgi:hypothetical protein